MPTNLDPVSLLLLYAADELSAPDRQRVETMLANDTQLRAQLDELTSMQDLVSAVFVQADAKTALPAPMLSSVRQVGSTMRQWQIDRLAKPTLANPRHIRKLGWLYASTAVAAGIIITIFVLWSRVDDGKPQPMVKLWDDTPAKQDANLAPQDDVAQNAPEPEAVAHVDPDDYTPTGVGDSDRQLSSAEHEMNALTSLSDSIRPVEDTVTP